MALETAAAARAVAAPAQQTAASAQPMRRTSDSATPGGSLTSAQSSNSISSSSSNSAACLLAVTGFGKFCGVTNNPSQTLVQRLPEFLRKQQQQEQQQQRESRSVGVGGPSAPLAPGWELGRCCVLEVAGEGALPQLQWVLSHPWADHPAHPQHPAHPADQPHQGGGAGGAKARGRQDSAAVPSGVGEAAPSLASEKAASAAVRDGGSGGQSSSRRTKLRRLVWLHLGVDSGSPCFAVEQRGVNEADFSCPDERGWQPWHQPISAEDGPITFIRETTLPAADMVQHLRSLGFRVRHSFSAGRFVCNYVYYQSLRHAATAAICYCDSCCSSSRGCACMSKRVASGAADDTAAEAASATAVHNGAQQSGGPPAATSPEESPAAAVSKQGSIIGSDAAPSASCCCGPTSNPPAAGAGGGCDGVVERSALFVHVPSFSVIGEEAQLRFLTALIRTLTHSLTLVGSPTPLSSSPLQQLPTGLAPSPAGGLSGEAAAAAALQSTRLPSAS